MKPQEPTYFNLGIGEDETQRNYFSLFPEELMASVIESFVINKPMIGKAGGDGFWVHQDKEMAQSAVQHGRHPRTAHHNHTVT